MKKSVLLAVLACAMASANVSAQVTFEVTDNGGYIVAGSLSDVLSITDTSVTSVSDFGVKLGEYYGGKKAIDFANGVVIEGPVTASIARDNGTVAVYNISGPIAAYAAQDTYREFESNYSLNGAIVYDYTWTNDEGEEMTKTLVEYGAISLIKN